MRRPDVDRFLSELSSDQLADWFVFYGLEPWGQPWENYILARHIHTQAMINRDPKKPMPQMSNFLWESETDRTMREHQMRKGLFDHLRSISETE